MGRDIHFYVTKLNKETNTWEELEIYNKHGSKVPAFSARIYELFDYLSNHPSSCSYTPETNKYVTGTVAIEFNSDYGEMGYFRFKELNLADLKLNIPKKYKWFIKLIEDYAYFAEEGCSDTDSTPSSYKLIYWFDN